jgi:hypothetical protein
MKGTDAVWKAHQPVGFFSTQDAFARCVVDPPHNATYITLKLSSAVPSAQMYIEEVKFSCVHGSHPLGKLIGTSALEKKAAEYKAQLLEAAVFDKVCIQRVRFCVVCCMFDVCVCCVMHDRIGLWRWTSSS